MNVLALGARVVCCGLIGNDRFGERVREMLNEAGAETGGLICAGDRPTITKTRLVGLAEHRHRQQILRVDDEVVRPPSEGDAGALLDAARRALGDVDVVCLEDYAKGLLSKEICAALLAAAAEAGKPVLVDPARKLPPMWPCSCEGPPPHRRSICSQPKRTSTALAIWVLRLVTAASTSRASLKAPRAAVSRHWS